MNTGHKKTNDLPEIGQLIEPEQYQINPKTIHWTARVITLLFKMFKLNLRIHGDESLWRQGDIYLFNHFARFETFIPQYIIYQKTGKFTRSIAGKEFFRPNDVFSRYLIELGGVPTNAKNLKLLMSSEIFHGRKMLAFPEGGIVKDRRSIDRAGKFNVFSRHTGERRKHHSGPAVIALAITIFKETILNCYANNQLDMLASWAKELKMDNVDALLQAARRPTRIIPCNITFYPMRISDNILRRGVELFQKGLSKRMSEELLVEGNILLKHTDMDIRIGEPINVKDYWTRWESTFVNLFSDQTARSLQSIFNTPVQGERWGDRIFQLSHRRNAARIRDIYMQTMYRLVTINIAHIASAVVMRLIERDEKKILCDRLHKLIYLATKSLQSHEGIYLHVSLKNPDVYARILTSTSEGFEQFLLTADQAKLITCVQGAYHFQDKLIHEHEFDEIRIENPVAVYANEVRPILVVSKAVDEAIAGIDEQPPRVFGEMLYDDMQREYEWDRAKFQDERHQKINLQETATRSGAPFLLIPDHPNGESLVLCHGLFASPAELHDLGLRFQQLGYFVVGVRMKGHGTSPWDLLEQPWQEWLFSLRRGIQLARCYSDRVHIVGFSTGGMLALYCASEQPEGLASVVSAAAPLAFNDAFIERAVPLLHGANHIMRPFTGKSGLFPFLKNDPEHPHINYRNMPFNSINELLKLVDETKEKLSRVLVPVMLLQADSDPIVKPSSLPTLKSMLKNAPTRVVWVPSNRHGVVFENTAQCQSKIIDFILQHHQKQP